MRKGPLHCSIAAARPRRLGESTLQKEPRTLVLGIGNVLWADEGFGVRAADTLHRYWDLPDNVAVKDGGTQGIYLLDNVQQADILVIFDAIDYGLEPATLRLIEGDAVPNYLGAKKVSLHQTGFQEVLAMAQMLGKYPSELLLVGVQPVQIEDFGGSLHTSVRAQIEPAIAAALDWLRARGIEAVRRATPLPTSASIAGAEIDMDSYEADRPSAQDACRVGDERVLQADEFTVGYRPQSLDPGAVSVDVDHRGKY